MFAFTCGNSLEWAPLSCLPYSTRYLFFPNVPYQDRAELFTAELWEYERPQAHLEIREVLHGYREILLPNDDVVSHFCGNA